MYFIYLFIFWLAYKIIGFVTFSHLYIICYWYVSSHYPQTYIYIYYHMCICVYVHRARERSRDVIKNQWPPKAYKVCSISLLIREMQSQPGRDICVQYNVQWTPVIIRTLRMLLGKCMRWTTVQLTVKLFARSQATEECAMCLWEVLKEGIQS